MDFPRVTFLVSSRKRRKDEFTLHDKCDTFSVAMEMADELADCHRHYEVVVFNSKGVEIYNTRKR